MNCRTWKCFCKFWKSVGLDILNSLLKYCVVRKPTFIKLIVNSKLLHAACLVQCITLNVRTVCDVIIAHSCGTLPAFTAIVLLLALDCVMQLWIRLCLKVVVYFSFRLDSDLQTVVLTTKYKYVQHKYTK